MSDKKIAIKKSTLEGIGNAVREKEGSTDLIPVPELEDRIRALKIGGGENVFAKFMNGETEFTQEDFKGITEIKPCAFYEYETLNIEMPPSVKTLDSNSFSVKSGTIKTYATTFRKNAFAHPSYYSSTKPVDIYLLADVFEMVEGILFDNGLKPNLKFNNAQAFYSFIDKTIETGGFCSDNEWHLYFGEENIKSLTFGEHITTIPNRFLTFNRTLQKVVFEGDITSVGSRCFYQCTAMISHMGEIDFTHCTQVPVLNGTYTFNGTSAKIKVPAFLYDEWINATNWSGLASRIVAV